MILKINAKYATPTGFLIPRSHLNAENGSKWCIVQVLTNYDGRFESRHTTMTTKELRKLLNIGAKERVDVV